MSYRFGQYRGLGGFLSKVCGIGLLLSCLGLVPAIAQGNRTGSGTPSLTEELRLMKQAGLPTSPRELQSPLPPESRNAAPLYRQLTELLKSKPLSEADKIANQSAWRRPLTAEQARQMRQALAHRTDITDLVHRAVGRPECVFDRKWEQGASMMFPEFATMRMTTRWLSAESALQLYDGKPMDALRTQALGFRVSEHVSHDPILIAYLVALATDSITLAGIERIEFAAGDRPGVAEAVLRVLNTDLKPRSLAHGLRGEFVLPVVEIAKTRKGKAEDYEKELEREMKAGDLSNDTPKLSAEDKLHFDRFIDRGEAAMLHHMRLLIAVADRPYGEARRELQKAEADLNAHRPDAAYVMLRVVAPVYGQSLEKAGKESAMVATDRAAASLFVWHATHGTFPERLDQAMKQVPVDPFDGKPIRYKREGAGFIVYSVGPTGKFDGGSATVKPASMETVVRYPLPAYVK